MIVKLAHTADNHLRDTQYSRKHRGLDFTHSFNYLVDTCISRGVDAILNSGDILDTTRPSPDALTTLKKIHAKLVQAEIPMYVISGNHDKTKPHWVSVLGSAGQKGGIICIDNETVNIKGITVRGIPYMHRDAFLKHEAEGEGADILLCHLAIVEFIDFPSKKAIELSEFPTERYKLIAAGDIHVHGKKTLSDGTVVSYPGSTEICRANEQPDKYVDLYEFNPNEGHRIESATSVSLPCRKLFYEQIQNEEEFVDLLKRLEAAKGDFPIISLRYRKEIENVSSRIRAVVDADRCIIRTLPYNDKLTLPNRGSTNSEDLLAPVEFVERFIIRGSPLFELGEALAQENTDAGKILNTYMEERLGRTELAV